MEHPYLILLIIVGYFGFLKLVGWLTARKATNTDFFSAGKNAPWLLVAIGMVGTTISGVTFISVPGEVAVNSFSYLQLVFGNVVGYLLIAFVLLPAYYRHNVVSIYSLLNYTIGPYSYRTGAFFFLISRLMGSALRLFLAVTVFQTFIFGPLGVPFEVSAALTLAFILLYSVKGGIKTLIYTDTLQTLFFIAAMLLSIYFILDRLGLAVADVHPVLAGEGLTKLFFLDPASPHFFVKQFLAGIFITVTMAGMDQEMMQKNISIRKLKDAQKNVLLFMGALLVVNILFLYLGGLLTHFSHAEGMALPSFAETGKLKTDAIYPHVSFNAFPFAFQIIFIIGLTAAAAGGADAALAALTTSVCIDFFNFKEVDTPISRTTRRLVHFSFALLTFLLMVYFDRSGDQSVISTLFKIAGYTYGPLLGLFVFGMFIKKQAADKWVPLFAVLAPLLSLATVVVVEQNTPYRFGFEVLLLTAFYMVAAMLVFNKKNFSLDLFIP